MKRLAMLSWLAMTGWPVLSLAADTPAPATVGDGLGRMVLGTVIVLIVIGVVAWVARRVLPGQGRAQAGVIRQVGGVHLGPRERVVVLEVAGRWLVVGVSPGQMTALGEVPAVQASTTIAEDDALTAESAAVDPQASFSVRLQQAMQHTLQQTVKSLKNKP